MKSNLFPFKPVAIAMTTAAWLAVTALPADAGETTNRLGITMVDIPAGSFQMGSCKVTSEVEAENKRRAFLGQAALSTNCGSSDPDASDDETPLHRVSIKAFQMGKTEVTLGQFKQYIAASGRSGLVDDEFMRYNRYGDDAPVVQVSWHDAQNFIVWLNKTAGGGYRLPSEAEWEYACRAGGNGKYCGGDNLDALGWYADNSGEHQHGVGQKQPNAWGLYDMSGNVREWVQDGWHDNYRGAPNDGAAWGGGDGRKVLRGGSCYLNSRYSRAAHRFIFGPAMRDHYYGFRLARTLP